MRIIGLLFAMIMLASCQSFAGDDTSATLSFEMTAFVTESAMIQETAVIEQTDVVATIQSAGTQVAQSSDVNLVLAATLQANIVPTTGVRSVIVNASDMGSSLEGEMMDEASLSDTVISGDLAVSNLGTGESVRASDGCSNGIVSQFNTGEDRIYFTARVSNLQRGVNFSLDWVYEERLIYRSSWTADYQAQSECIWFYMTPDDAPFVPGVYTVTLFVDGQSVGSQSFSINAG